jgi:hypothetical protein
MTASIRSILRPAAAALALALLALPAQARTMFGVTAANALVRFDDATPGSITSVPVSGLQPGETVLGIDFRPLDEQLYALGSTSRLYRIDLATGAATQVGSGTFLIPLQGSSFGFDFNPVVDRVRIVSDANQNLRINPNDGAVVDFDSVTAGVQPDSNLAYAGGDPNSAADPAVVGAGYSNSFAGATTTTLYGIDSGIDRLVIQNPPNNGVLNTVGALGFDTSSVVGFDLLETNVARAALVVGGVTGLYSINLGSGAATLLGTLGAPIRSLAAAPAGYSATLVGNTATFTAGVGQQTLRFISSGGLLRHNRFSLGGSGFASDFDFDPATPGDQTLSASDAAVTVNVLAGGYDDIVSIGDATRPSGLIAANFNINGGIGHDVLEIDDSANASIGRNVTLNPTSVAGLAGGILHGSIETLLISGGGGADGVTVGAAIAATTLRTGGGNDIVVFNSTGSLAGGLLDGGAGTDIADLSFYSAAVTADFATTRTLFLARNSAMQEAGPLSNSDASGNGVFVLDPAQTVLSVQQTYKDVTGTAISGVHFHNAAAGTNGPIVRDLGPDAGPIAPPSGSFATHWRDTDPVASFSGPLTPALVTELLANRIYLNIHTTPNFPSGELRGQLINQGAVGVLSGTGGVRGFEILDLSLFKDGFE